MCPGRLTGGTAARGTRQEDFDRGSTRKSSAEIRGMVREVPRWPSCSILFALPTGAREGSGQSYISRYIFSEHAERRVAAEGTMFVHYGYCGPHGHRAKWGWDASFMNSFFGAEGRPRGRW